MDPSFWFGLSFIMVGLPLWWTTRHKYPANPEDED